MGWRSRHGWARAASAAVLLWAAVAGTAPARAAGIGWEKPGAFQACLDGKAKAWIDAKVELVVNDDPDMGAIDDTAVAEWATRALKECTAKAPGGDPASELQFMKYMAHWRDHIYTAADEMRRRNRPD
ncbi:MAG TPA: hypothetical protein VH913_11055 [Hyphomicrobiaceae bacterium]